MAPCRIETRPEFLDVVRQLKRRFPQVQKDLEILFRRIVPAPTEAAHARRYELGDSRYEAYTYNCPSTDMGKGANRAFRVVARYDKTENVVTPLTMIYKGDSGYVPADEVLQAIKALEASRPPAPPPEPPRPSDATPP